MGQGDTSSTHPQTPLGDRALPRLQGEHQAPHRHQHRSRESSVESRNCHLFHPAPQRRRGGGRAPSPSPTRLIAIVRAAERPGGIQEFAVLGEGTRTCPKPRIRHQEGGLSSFWGRRELLFLASPADGASSAGADTGREESCARVQEETHRLLQGLLPSPEPGAEAVQTHCTSSSRDWGGTLGELEKQAETPCPSPHPAASCVGWPAPGR